MKPTCQDCKLALTKWKRKDGKINWVCAKCGWILYKTPRGNYASHQEN